VVLWVGNRRIEYEVREGFFELVCSGMSLRLAAGVVGVSERSAQYWWAASGVGSVQGGGRGGLAGSAPLPVGGGGAVWSLAIGTGILYALNPSTGTVITSISVGPVEHFATPMLSGGDVFVPVSDGVVAVSGA